MFQGGSPYLFCERRLFVVVSGEKAFSRPRRAGGTRIEPKRVSVNKKSFARIRPRRASRKSGVTREANKEPPGRPKRQAAAKLKSSRNPNRRRRDDEEFHKGVRGRFAARRADGGHTHQRRARWRGGTGQQDGRGGDAAEVALRASGRR